MPVVQTGLVRAEIDQVTTVLICDDDWKTREVLRRAVQGMPGVDRVMTAGSGQEVLARWSVDRPALVLLDATLPAYGGIETIRRIVHDHPNASVVVLTDRDEPDVVASAVTHGARGFLRKDASYEELCATVAAALTPALGGAEEARSTRSADAPDLTEREMQVLDGMANGKSNGQIGRELYLSEDTIKTHARRLFRKLGVNDRAQAVALGFRFGLVR